MNECPSMMEEQKKRPSQTRTINMWGLHAEKASQYGGTSQLTSTARNPTNNLKYNVQIKHWWRDRANTVETTHPTRITDCAEKTSENISFGILFICPKRILREFRKRKFVIIKRVEVATAEEANLQTAPNLTYKIRRKRCFCCFISYCNNPERVLHWKYRLAMLAFGYSMDFGWCFSCAYRKRPG